MGWHVSRAVTQRARLWALGGLAVLLALALAWSRRSEAPTASRAASAETDPTNAPEDTRSRSEDPEHELAPSPAALEQRLAELRATEADLRAELEDLRALGETREHFVERCGRRAGRGCPVAHPPKDVLEARARCGTIVWDGASAPQLGEDLREELGFTDAEQDALVRIAGEVEEEVGQATIDNFRRATGEDPPADGFPSAMMALEIELHRRFPDESAVPQLAKELAGQEPRPSRFEDRTPYYWHMRARLEAGDRLEESLASELGAERARELRMATGGWGGTTMYSAGLCPDRPE